MVDSCRQLTVSQSNGDDDTAGMVTILTGHTVEELVSRSAAMKVSLSSRMRTSSQTQPVKIPSQLFYEECMSQAFELC